MTEHGEQSLLLDDAKKMLMKEKEENNTLKKTISQKDETIESLKRWLQIYQHSLKEKTFNVEAKNNIIDCMKEIEDLKETDIDDSMIRFDDLMTDNVDDLVDFVNKDVIGEEIFLRDIDGDFDLGSEVAVEKLDNIDIKELATFSDFSLTALAKDSSDDVISEIMSSPFDDSCGSIKCVFDDNGKESKESEDSVIDLPIDPNTSEVQIVNTGEPLRKKLVDKEVPEEVSTVEDDLMDVVEILDSSCDEMSGVPPVEKLDLVPLKKETPRKNIKRRSDIRITESAKKWLMENDFNKLYETDSQSPEILVGSNSALKEHGIKDISHQPLPKFDEKSATFCQAETNRKGTVLYKMFECSKCGISFSMDRKDVLNSFHKPGTPKCTDCQTSPKDKTKLNFYSRKNSVAVKLKIENKTKNTIKDLTPSAQAKSSSKPSHLQCEACGKSFPLGGEWKYKKHMEVHAEAKKEENKCDVCQESFKYKSTQIAHMKTHEGKDPFQCNLCQVDFKQIDDLVSHGVMDHKKRSVRGLLDLLGTQSK